MSKAPAAWTRTPLQVLSTAPTQAPRLPADKRPAYRPKISKKRKRKPPPRRVPPRAPTRSDRATDADVERFQQCPTYIKALQAARVARIAAAPETSRRRGEDIYHGFGLKRLSAKDELRERDFRAINSSGLDVPRTDAELRQFLRTGERPARGTARLSNAKAPEPKTGLRARPGEPYFDRKARRSAERASAAAPIIKIADYTLRPTYATAGAASAIARGKSAEEALKAAGRGFTGKERKTFSTVLREQGIGGAKASILGFGLDVLADPTTWVSFGASSAVRKAAVKAGRHAAAEAEKAALKQGASKTQARLRAIDARNRAHAETLKSADVKPSARETGLQVKVAGTAFPGIERATGAARHYVRRAGQGASRAVPQSTRETGGKLRNVGRKIGAELNANVREVDPITNRAQTRASQASEKGLRREARSEQQAITRNLTERLNAMRGFVSKDEMGTIIDAIEAGDLKSLKGAAPIRTRRLKDRGIRKNPDRLYLAARNVEADLKHLNRLGRNSGAITGRIGKRSRTRLEGMTNLPKARSTAKIHAELKTARQAQAQARIALRAVPADAKPSVRLAARRRVRHTQDRVEFLRKRNLSLQRRQADVATARDLNRGSRQHRQATQARGYFPRVTKDEAEIEGTLDRLAKVDTGTDIPYAQVGSNRPNIGPAQTRKNRGSRAQLRANPKTKHLTEDLSEDIRASMEKYASSVARGVSTANLNTRLISDLGRKLPRNPTKGDLAALRRQGYGVYRVKQGVLEELHPEDNFGQIVRAARGPRTQAHPRTNPKTGEAFKPVPQGLKVRLDPKTSRPAAPRSTSGQVALLDNAQLRRIRAKQTVSGKTTGATFDAFQRGWKTLALSTPGYLVRNLFGDTYNAWQSENALRLARNQARSAKVLGKTASTERGLRRFERGADAAGVRKLGERFRNALPGDRQTVALTSEQAAQIAKALKLDPKAVAALQGARRGQIKLPAEMVGMLAERMGVIRQGRFVELMQDARKPRGSNAWKDISKRVEDQTRLATFLGGLHRGMDPREAAQRASSIHFDYGDLTDHERNAFRRAAPFYTFPARNVPLQGKRLVQRPQKFGTFAKAAEEGRRAAGLSDDFQEGQSPYEQRQLGVPIKYHGKTYTVSIGLPFTDLNDVGAVASNLARGEFAKAGEAVVQRVMEATGPAVKLAPELISNHSFFYRDEIQPEKEPFTRAPQWAIDAGKRSAFARKKLGLIDDYLPPDAPGKVWGWPRKIDYAFRQGQPGPINPLLDVLGKGVEGANARQMTKAQRLLAFAGLRAIKYESDPAQLNRLYDRRDTIQTELDLLGRRAGKDPTLRGTSSNATPRGAALAVEMAAIEKQLDALQKKTRPGGLVHGKRNRPQDNKPGGFGGATGFGGGGGGFGGSTGF
jgi:hypothetical protein